MTCQASISNGIPLSRSRRTWCRGAYGSFGCGDLDLSRALTAPIGLIGRMRSWANLRSRRFLELQMSQPSVPGWSLERLEAHAAVVLDHSGTAVYASEAFLRLTGIPIDRVLGSNAPSDRGMERAFEHGRAFLLDGSMARLGMSTGELDLPARPHPVRCRFRYDGVPEDAPVFHVFLFEQIDASSPESRSLRMERALYQIQLILDRVGLPERRSGPEDPLALASLTNRELDVVKLLLDGRSNEQIASELHVSIHTIKSHALAIFRKLEVHSRAELLSKFVHPSARRRPLGPSEDH